MSARALALFADWEELLRAIAAAAPIALTATASTLLGQTIPFTSTPVGGVFADGLATAPDGSLWSVNQAANTISHVTFPDLHAATFNVPTAGSGLTFITAGPDGNMWFTESTVRKIGRIDAGGTIVEFPTPASAALPQRIFPGPGGALWATACPFLEPLFFGCSNFIVMTTAGAATVLPIRTPSGASFGPDHCTLGADGNLWCFGNESTSGPFSSSLKIARIDPSGGYTAFVPPTATQASAILTAPDGNVWYTWLGAAATGLARITPSGTITEYPVPSGGWVFGLATGTDGNLYFTERQNQTIGELVLATAADDGSATLETGPAGIDIPEDLVAVSGQAAPASIRRAQGAGPTAHCPAGASFVVRSGGSDFNEIVWIRTPEETVCTDLIAVPENQRGAATFGELNAGCYDFFNSLDPAEHVSMTITLAKFDVVDKVDMDPVPEMTFSLPWDSCDVVSAPNGNAVVVCTASSIPQGKFSIARVTGSFGLDKVTVLCLSDTPDVNPVNNEYPLYPLSLGVVSIPESSSPPVNIDTRW